MFYASNFIRALKNAQAKLKAQVQQQQQQQQDVSKNALLGLYSLLDDLLFFIQNNRLDQLDFSRAFSKSRETFVFVITLIL